MIDDIGITPKCQHWLFITHGVFALMFITHVVLAIPKRGKRTQRGAPTIGWMTKRNVQVVENCRLNNNFGKRLDWPRVFDISGDLAVDHEAQEKCELQVFLFCHHTKRTTRCMACGTMSVSRVHSPMFVIIGKRPAYNKQTH